jgi:hypothetical protein
MRTREPLSTSPIRSLVRLGPLRKFTLVVVIISRPTCKLPADAAAALPVEVEAATGAFLCRLRT